VSALHLPGLPNFFKLAQESHLFQEFKFVLIDVCPDRNCPAMSTHQILEHWLQPKFVQDFSKIVGFAQLYGKFIPQLSFKLPHFGTSYPNLNIPSLLHHIGQLPPKIPSMT
jgi:hypothetical protein